MLRTSFPLLGLLCTAGLVACDSASDVEPGTSSEDVTIRLNRTENGSLEYCDDATGECQTLPYDGRCAVIEVDIDPATGGTCETCILDDGSIVDQGCDDTTVGCVLVTLPDPDCVVCAYVDGDIFFSTCTVGDPVCTSDLDCRSDDGTWGYCVNGECVFEPNPCWNVDCPPGHHCEPRFECDTAPCQPTASCVPDFRECLDDGDCPAGFGCSVVCPPGTDPGDPDVDPLPCSPDDPDCGRCVGSCEPILPDECQSDRDCPDGYGCVIACPVGTGPGDPLPTCSPDDPDCGQCVGVCEPLWYECSSDLDCVTPDGLMGVCIDGACHYDNTTCSDDLDCPDGYVCKYYDALVPRPCDPGTDVDCVPVPSGVCVPAPRVCETHDDCAFGGVNAWCIDGECVWEVDCDPNHAACDMIPPTCPDGEVPSVVGGCFGPCVPVEACMPIIPGCADDSQCGPDDKCIVECWDCIPEDPTCVGGCEGVCVPVDPGCTSNADCGPNEECVSYCWECIPEDPTCVGGCEGYCQPVGDECLKDADCTDPTGLQGYCVSGWCYYEPPYCFTDSDCPEGQTCIFDDTYCGRDPGDTPIWCGGYCSGEPPPSDCFRTGCSLEFCSDRAVDTPCNYLPEYACYDRAVCERQAGGACGWTMTPDAEQCFADFDYPDPGNP